MPKTDLRSAKLSVKASKSRQMGRGVFLGRPVEIGGLIGRIPFAAMISAEGASQQERFASESGMCLSPHQG